MYFSFTKEARIYRQEMWIFLMSVPPAEVKVGAKPEVGPKSWVRSSDFSLPPQRGPNSRAMLCVIFNASSCTGSNPTTQSDSSPEKPPSAATAPHGLCHPHWNASANSRLFLTISTHRHTTAHTTAHTWQKPPFCMFTHATDLLRIVMFLHTVPCLENGVNLKSYKRTGWWSMLYL